jgi:hypothetical protein
VVHQQPPPFGLRMTTTKDIRPSDTFIACDVCGRTLLRGERSEVFVHAGARRSVCELCKSRALHEGWIREGAIPEYGADTGAAERGRSLLGRMRRPREGGPGGTPTLDDALSEEWTEPVVGGDGFGAADRTPGTRRTPGSGRAPRAGGRERRAARAERGERGERGERAEVPVVEPRHVRAVPTNVDHRIATALEIFNRSERPRTVAGVARSLGAPTVNVIPDSGHPTLVRVVVSWELCWYRYEIDLSEQGVRLDGQGYELGELADAERLRNAAADEAGHLSAA